jgi:hypothetical protein
VCLASNLDAIIDILSLVVNACMFNQSCEHWLLFYVLHAMALKLKKIFGMVPSMANSMKDDIVVILELFMFASNIRK